MGDKKEFQAAGLKKNTGSNIPNIFMGQFLMRVLWIY
jgi:hypothetical protein